MKFIAEPVKYKQRYRWERLYEGHPNEEWDRDYYYWKEMWTSPKATNLGFVLLSVPELGYFISSNEHGVDPRTDMGPYPDLPTCKLFAELFMDMKHEPKWTKRRRRK